MRNENTLLQETKNLIETQLENAKSKLSSLSHQENLVGYIFSLVDFSKSYKNHIFFQVMEYQNKICDSQIELQKERELVSNLKYEKEKAKNEINRLNENLRNLQVWKNFCQLYNFKNSLNLPNFRLNWRQ